MKKYIYFPTWNNHWLDISEELLDKKIAEPILWIGDYKHLEKARKRFGNEVVKDRDFFVFKSHQISNFKYNCKSNDFFLSNDYIITKDKALKMMDRLDDFSMMSRIDREAIFNNVVIWILNKFERTLPDALIAVEHPHTHVQFTIFQICKYLNIPCVKFNSWLPIPVVNLQNSDTGELIKKQIKIDEVTINQYSTFFQNYIENIFNKGQKYEASHIELVRQRSNNNSWKLQKSVNFLKDIFRKYKSKNNFLESKLYNPLDPFKISPFQRLSFIRKRKKNLVNSLNKNVSKSVKLNVKYVYFGLHYEPERTTLPDGGVFHDQFLALIKLREIIPEKMIIYVKEHPSMFFDSLTGYKGRSPVFYSLIKNIKGVKLLNHDVSTLELIRNSVFTATITGTIGLESAILGKKSLIFGNSWYDGCPNTIKWTSKVSYELIHNTKLYQIDAIIQFFDNLLRDKCVIGFLNSRTEFRLNKFKFKGFEDIQYKGIYDLIYQFLKLV